MNLDFLISRYPVTNSERLRDFRAWYNHVIDRSIDFTSNIPHRCAIPSDRATQSAKKETREKSCCVKLTPVWLPLTVWSTCFERESSWSGQWGIWGVWPIAFSYPLLSIPRLWYKMTFHSVSSCQLCGSAGVSIFLNQWVGWLDEAWSAFLVHSLCVLVQCRFLYLLGRWYHNQWQPVSYRRKSGIRCWSHLTLGNPAICFVSCHCNQCI